MVMASPMTPANIGIGGLGGFRVRLSPSKCFSPTETMTEFKGHHCGEYDDNCPICYLDAEVERLSAEVTATNAAFEESDAACADLEAKNSRLVDRVDLLEGVVKTCHLAFVKIPDLVLGRQ